MNQPTPPSLTQLMSAADDITLREFERGIEQGLHEKEGRENGEHGLLTDLLRRQQQRKFKNFVRAVFEEEMGRPADQEPELALD